MYGAILCLTLNLDPFSECPDIELSSGSGSGFFEFPNPNVDTSS